MRWEDEIIKTMKDLSIGVAQGGHAKDAQQIQLKPAEQLLVPPDQPLLCRLNFSVNLFYDFFSVEKSFCEF